MIDGMKRLIGKYPQVALGCCGIYLINMLFMISAGLPLIEPHLTHPPPWLFIVAVELTSFATGVMLVVIAILWGLRQRRSKTSDAPRRPQASDGT